MITKEQCRAARSFIGLKQADLAKDCGLSKTAITHFESGLFRPRTSNMIAIKEALEGYGIEFIGQTGVQKRETAFRVIEGDNMYVEVWDDIFETLKETGGEVCIGYCSEREPAHSNLQELEDHLKRLEDHNIKERIIVCEGDDYFIQKPECYRWLPYSIYKSGNLFFVYGDKVATQYWNGAVSMIVQNDKIAQHEKKRFEYLWEISRFPDSLLK